MRNAYTMNTIRFFALAALVGCGSEPTGSQADGLITRTIVHLAPDGSVASQKTVQLTQAQANADFANELWAQKGYVGLAPSGSGLHAEGTVVSDDSCASSSMQMFDETDQQGDELCVYATALPACGNLDDFQFWAGSVRSYYSGNQYGAWYANSSCGGACSSGFNPYTEVDDADSCTQGASSIYFFEVGGAK